MVLETEQAVFFVGCGGGLLAELLHWWGLRSQAQLPVYVKSPFYWAVTLLMVGAGGLVAWLYFGMRGEAVLVTHVGLSTPLLLQKLATAAPEPQGSKNVVAAPAASVRQFFTW